MTKERRCYFAMTLIMSFLFLVRTALFDDLRSSKVFGIIQTPIAFDIVQIVQFFYGKLPEPT